MDFKITTPKIDWLDPARLVPLNKDKVDGIGLHHMDNATASFEDINSGHQNRKPPFIGIGYNYWISFKGEIFQGRGFNQGAGIAGHNDHLIHVGFQGDYEHANTKMPDDQFNAGVWLIGWLKKQLPNARVVHGHRHWAATLCPGKNFPLAEMLASKYRKPIVAPMPKPKDELSEAIKLLQKNGIINSPDYWLDNARKGKKCEGEYVGFLIQRLAEKLK